jgi:hypothetical protein
LVSRFTDFWIVFEADFSGIKLSLETWESLSIYWWFLSGANRLRFIISLEGIYRIWRFVFANIKINYFFLLISF